MRLFSTEQVSKYHPDKYADQISDAILDECLKQDKNSHCGIEVMVKDNTIVLGGEITSNAIVDYAEIVNKVANKLNYKVDKIINLIGEQSLEINNAVVGDENIGAGDQGIMFGYACDDNEEYLPKAFYTANRIIEAIENDVANKKTILIGDAKTQVTIDLDTNKLHTILISVCHKSGLTLNAVKNYIKDLLVYHNIDTEEAELLINPAGTWNVGGPISDCGLTGRKIVCDQYGGFCAVGGGAFSGKDPSKVDRSASYMARWIAIDILYKFSLKEAEVELAYAIGKAEPVSVGLKLKYKALYIDENVILENAILNYINNKYDLTPKGIIKFLNLTKLNYEYYAEGNTMGKIAKLYNEINKK